MTGAQQRLHIEQLVQRCLLDNSAGRLGTRRALRRVVVGFSGGADSSALLVAAARVIAAHFDDLQLLALYVDHGLQAAADNWRQHCADVCAELDVPLQVEKVTVAEQGNLEANARAQRYDVFARYCTRGSLLLLGHHQHDQTETILYRLFQGRGMLPMRSHGQLGDGQFARPLLAVAPAQLRAYLQHLNVRWIEDPSNQDVRLNRNFLRHHVVPLLNRRWQQLHHALARVGGAQAAIQTALEHELAAAAESVPLARLPEGEAAVAWLRAYLHSRGVYGVADKALTSFAEQLRAPRAELNCGGGCWLRSYDRQLHFVPAMPVQDEVPLSIAVGQQVSLAGGTLSLEAAPQSGRGVFCYAGPLRIAYREGGERIQLTGFRKSLKQLFAEAKVPTWQRDVYPLLYLGDELVCVPNLAVAAPYRPGDGCEADAVALCVAVWRPHQSPPRGNKF